MTDEELDVLVVDVRRQWGDRFPVPSRGESAVERDLREQITRDVIEREVLPYPDRFITLAASLASTSPTGFPTTPARWSSCPRC